MRRLPILLALTVACSSTPGASTTSPSPTTSTTSPPTSSTTTTAPETESLAPPELPDPVDLAEAPLEDLDPEGFSFADVDPDLVDVVRVRVGAFGGVTAGSIWDELVSDDGAEVVAFTIYPAGSARGDPGLTSLAADIIVQAGTTFDPPTEGSLLDRAVLQVTERDLTWFVWANNTHLFVTAGTADGPADVMKSIIAEVAGSEYQWSEGDCLYFEDGVPYAPFGEGNVVPCDGPHEWEVTASAPLTDAADAPFPDAELGVRVGASCEEAFFEFTGVLPIDSALNQVFYLPDEAEWEEGDRYYACLVSRNDGRGGAELRTGSLRGQTEAVTRAVGGCYRRIVDVGLVDCSEPHVFEFIGMAEYPGDEDDDYPGGQELSDAFEQACRTLIEGYVSDPTVEGATVTPFPLGFSAFGWERGLRQVPCYAYATDDGRALEVVGSFSGGWGPLGEADGAIQA